MRASSRSSLADEIRPVRSSRSARSSAMICATFATESFGRPVIAVVNSKFPGAAAHRRLLVSGTQTAVASRLRFSASPWTTMTGRRNPGRARRLRQLGPADVALGDHHSVSASIRRPAAARKASSFPPISSHARFMASVTSSCARRSRYSLSAAAYTSLRVRLPCEASRSARSKMSSGMETAIFIPAI